MIPRDRRFIISGISDGVYTTLDGYQLTFDDDGFAWAVRTSSGRTPVQGFNGIPMEITARDPGAGLEELERKRLSEEKVEALVRRAFELDPSVRAYLEAMNEDEASESSSTVDSILALIEKARGEEDLSGTAITMAFLEATGFDVSDPSKVCIIHAVMQRLLGR